MLMNHSFDIWYFFLGGGVGVVNNEMCNQVIYFLVTNFSQLNKNWMRIIYVYKCQGVGNRVP